MFLEISQNSQEKTCARASILIKLQAWPAPLLKRGLWHRCFPLNFVKFLRTPFSQNTYGRLLLSIPRVLCVIYKIREQAKSISSVWKILWTWHLVAYPTHREMFLRYEDIKSHTKEISLCKLTQCVWLNHTISHDSKKKMC